MNHDVIKEVSGKRYDTIQEIQKFNPYHGADGRFASASSYTQFTIRTKDPKKQHMADMAIAREKEKQAANGAARVETAENTLKSMLRPDAVVNLKGCDPDVAAETVASVKKVMDRYPIAKDAVDGITTDDTDEETFKNNPNVMACYDNGTRMVYLNKKYFGDKATMDKAYDEAVEKKYHPEGTRADSVITHEIGHALDWHVSAQVLGRREVYWGGERISSRKWNNDIAAGRRKGEPLTNISIRDNLSLYGSKNHAEYFAEGFAEGIHSPTPRKTATSIMKHLDTYVKKAINKPKDKW